MVRQNAVVISKNLVVHMKISCRCNTAILSSVPLGYIHMNFKVMTIFSKSILYYVIFILLTTLPLAPCLLPAMFLKELQNDFQIRLIALWHILFKDTHIFVSFRQKNKNSDIFLNVKQLFTMSFCLRSVHFTINRVVTLFFSLIANLFI